MIIDLAQTTAAAVADRLVRLRDEGGAVALGRVLTLVVEARPGDVEPAIEAATAASHEHPCRVVVVDRSSTAGPGVLDAQIRLGSDAGAGEVVVLRPHGPVCEETDTLVIPLLLPDVPVVAWWPGAAPAAPVAHPLGVRAGRRITEAENEPDPVGALAGLRENYHPGDTDLGWSRITMWRALLAAVLDTEPDEAVTGVTVHAGSGGTAAVLLAAWLAASLGCPTSVHADGSAPDVVAVRLDRRIGPVALARRPGSSIVTLDRPAVPRQQVVLPARTRAGALAEELRRLGPDETYGRALRRGLERVEIHD